MTPANNDIRYFDEFITVHEEEEILAQVRGLALRPVMLHGVESKRKIASFGLDYKTGTRTLAPAPPIPDYLITVRDRAAEISGCDPAILEQALVTWYPIGAAIDWHVDHLSFGDTIIAASLLGHGRLQLRRTLKTPILMRRDLAPRSLYVLPARYRYDHLHRVTAREERWSVTFRNIAHEPVPRRRAAESR